MKTISLVALAVLAVVWSVSGEVDFRFMPPIELPSHRLPTNVRPLHYEIHLNFSRKSYSDDSYSGTMKITIEFNGTPSSSSSSKWQNCITKYLCLGETKPSSPTGGGDGEHSHAKQIVMHADHSVLIRSINVYKRGPFGIQKLLSVAEVRRDGPKQLIAMTMKRALPTNGTKGYILVEFEFRLRQDMRGIYESKHSLGYDSRVSQIVAKFQPTFARLALPCFDEPAFKANFSLSITHSKFDKAFATTPLKNQEDEAGGPIRDDSRWIRSYFETTPTMPIHMLSFFVAAFESLELDDQASPRLQVLTPRGLTKSGAYALEVARESIKWFEDYIGVKFPLEKLDLVAISDTDTDNTETWGLVFVRDTLLLIDSETKPDSKIQTAVNVAHVVVHQWFANLITAEWWDDLWITESIAAHMAFEFVASKYPEYQSDYFVRISTLSSIVQSDASGKKHSLSPPEEELATSSQVYELFDNIEFMKSGALASLTRETLGDEEFRQALQFLARKWAYGNVNLADLLEAIYRVPRAWVVPIDEILKSWSTLKSYPLINAVLDESKRHLVLYQEAYPTARGKVVPSAEVSSLSSGQNTWTVPLNVSFSGNTAELEAVTTEWLGPGASVKIALPEWFVPAEHWLKVSPHPTLSTFYRVRYSDELLGQLRSPIEQKQLSPMDRLHLLDDSNALVSSRLIKNDTFKELLGWYTNEDDYALIIEMLVASRTLSALELTDKSPSSSSQVFMRLYEAKRFNVDGSETLLEQRARMVTLNALIAQGVEQVIEDGLAAFEEAKNGKVALFLREPVYAALMARGTKDQVNLFLERLERRETKSYEEKVRLSSALALRKDITIRSRFFLYLSTISGLKYNVRRSIENLFDQTQQSRVKMQSVVVQEAS